MYVYASDITQVLLCQFETHQAFDKSAPGWLSMLEGFDVLDEDPVPLPPCSRLLTAS